MIFNSKNKKLFAGAVSFLFLLVLLMPVLSNAALVPCGNNITPGSKLVNGEEVQVLVGACDFTDFIRLINNIINWIIGIAGVIFTLMAVYGGFLYMTSGENESNKGKAKSILLNTLLGFVIILTSWLIVYTILNTLIPNDGTSVYRGSIFQFIGNGN